MTGTQFLSCGFDQYVRLWDTETGQCTGRFTNHKIPYCAKFNPDADKQHLFLAGCADKKVLQWDVREQAIVQEYDRHLGAVNTITFIDNNRRFVTTSDDKSIRVWEWCGARASIGAPPCLDRAHRDGRSALLHRDTPVEIKYIADPAMHSMPATVLHPNRTRAMRDRRRRPLRPVAVAVATAAATTRGSGAPALTAALRAAVRVEKWLICQSMDNRMYVFSTLDRFRMHATKRFGGHLVAGYACQPGVSPDGIFVISGDAQGKLNIWDWKTTKLYSRIDAHDGVCMCVQWHPHESSRVVTCGWDGLIKYWD